MMVDSLEEIAQDNLMMKVAHTESCSFWLTLRMMEVLLTKVDGSNV